MSSIKQKNKSNKTEPSDHVFNENILKWFRLLIKQLEFYVDTKTKKEKLIYTYKVNSIRKAYKAIKSLNYEITSGKQVKDVEGLGKGSMRRIDEILETGQLAEVNEADISGAHLEYVEDLMKIFGIGRVKAYELYTDHGIKSIEDLKAALKSGKIELPEAVKVGLKYVDVINTRIPRAEMDEIYTFLVQVGIEVDPELDVRVCGSYRREVPHSGDVDVIVAHPSIETKAQAEKSNLMMKFIGSLKHRSFIVDSLTGSDTKTKYMGLCKLAIGKPVRRIDIRFMPQESYYTAILYFTGSGEFNQRMRQVAQTMGYTLNEYALTRLSDGAIMPVKSEKDVFDYLSMDYQLPVDRI